MSENDNATDARVQEEYRFECVDAEVPTKNDVNQPTE